MTEAKITCLNCLTLNNWNETHCPCCGNPLIESEEQEGVTIIQLDSKALRSIFDPNYEEE